MCNDFIYIISFSFARDALGKLHESVSASETQSEVREELSERVYTLGKKLEQ